MLEPLQAASIQRHLPIKEIKNEVIILKGGNLRAILMASSFNFSLKSQEEQDAIIYRYQECLNSIDFPIQLVVASRKFDIDDYLELLRQKQVQQKNDLLKIQTMEYIEFVKSLTDISNIMTESFYIVIPYNRTSQGKKKLFGKAFKKILGKKGKEEDEEMMDFEKAKNNLWQRMEFIATSLQGMGIKTAPLNSEELVELFYKLYNPSAKEELEIKKAKELRNQ